MAKLNATIDAKAARSGSEEFVKATEAMVVAARKQGKASTEAAQDTARAAQKQAQELAKAAAEAKRAYDLAAKAATKSSSEEVAAALYAAGVESRAASERASIAARNAANYQNEAREAQRSAQQQVAAVQEVAKGAKSAAATQAEAQKSAMGLYSAMAMMAAGGVARSVVGTISSYEQLNASLVTVTGSSQEASHWFNELKKFAEVTPFTTEEATKAFVHMKAVGLDPTIDKLRAFGDAASVRPDRSFLDFIMAVSDGCSGASKRLKDFGIDIDYTSKNATITYKGLSTTVKNNAHDIEQELIKLSKTNFGGSMERQSKTLAGLWSTLSDKAASLAMEIGEAGLLSALKDLVSELTATTASGESTAKALGEGLGAAVTILGEGAVFLATHLEEVKSVLLGLAVVKTAETLMAVAGAFTATTVAADGTKVAILSLEAITPFGWVAIGIAAIYELYQHWDSLINVANEYKNISRDLMGEEKNHEGRRGSYTSWIESLDEDTRESMDDPFHNSPEQGPFLPGTKEAEHVDTWAPHSAELSDIERAGKEYGKKHAKSIVKGIKKGAKEVYENYEDGSLFAPPAGVTPGGSGGKSKGGSSDIFFFESDWSKANQNVDSLLNGGPGGDLMAELTKDLGSTGAKSPADYFVESAEAISKAQEKAFKEKSPIEKYIIQLTDAKRATEEWQEFAVGAFDSFADAAAAAMFGTKGSFKEMALALGEDTAKLVIKMGLAALLKAFLFPAAGAGTLGAGLAGGIGNAIAGAVAFHEGGDVGAGGSPRMVDPSWFVHAPPRDIATWEDCPASLSSPYWSVS